MYLLMDIGGTNTRLTISADSQTFSEPIVFSTPPNFEAAVQELGHRIKQLCEPSQPATLVAGFPGVLRDDGSLFASPNLAGWVDKPLLQSLQSLVSCPVHLINDADLGGLGEAIYGAGRGYSIVSYLTVSTGVGGVRIVDGKIDAARWGFEPGQQFLDISGSVCPDCPSPTSLENLIGGASMEERYQMPPQQVQDPAVWNQCARYLAAGLHNMTVFWSPDIIILGGPMMNNIPLPKVRLYLSEYLKIFPSPPSVESATLGDSKGLFGALAYLSQTKA